MKSVAGQDENMNQSVNAPEADWPRWLYAGDTALILEFGNTVHPSINAKVLAMATSIKKHKILGFVEAVPAFRSISIYFDPLVTDHEQVKLACTELPLETAADLKPANIWQIPVCYDAEFGLDLEETANVLDIGVDEVIQRHVDSDFRVYVLGFMPGFSFLGGLDKTLNLPRRKSPRKLVPRGSVAIAMGLGGVYPFDSPGGWHLLGKSPVKMYDGNREPAIFFEPGDGVKFVPIDRSLYEKLDQKGGVCLDQLKGETPFG